MESILYVDGGCGIGCGCQGRMGRGKRIAWSGRTSTSTPCPYARLPNTKAVATRTMKRSLTRNMVDVLLRSGTDCVNGTAKTEPADAGHKVWTYRHQKRFHRGPRNSQIVHLPRTAIGFHLRSFARFKMIRRPSPRRK